MSFPGSPLSTEKKRVITQADCFTELERGVKAALETYSNVHRGTGHFSMVSTRLFEAAREIIMEYLGLDKKRYVVVFCTPERAEIYKTQLEPSNPQVLSSQDIGLPLGLRALAIEKRALPNGAPFQTGGGTVKMVSHDSVIWADAPDKFEAGTPAIVSAIALAKALQIIQAYGKDLFSGNDVIATATQIIKNDDLQAFSGKELLFELRKRLVGGGVLVPTSDGTQTFIEMDNGASTPTFYPIWDVVCQTWKQPKRAWGDIIEAVKEICAEFLNAPLNSYDILFTSNTTEALNIFAKSLREPQIGENKTVILNTLLEHNSNELPWRYIPGTSLVRLMVDVEGFINLDELEKVLKEYNQDHRFGNKQIKLVAVGGASNVLGSFNNIEAISQITHQYGAHLVVDAAQLVAHRRVEMLRWGIDCLAFSGHKIYAPFGAGALVVRKGLLDITPSELEKIRKSGEENVVGIAALGKAINLLHRIGMDVIEAEERKLTKRTLIGLREIPGIEVFGIKDPDAARFWYRGGVISFSLKKIPYNLVAMKLAEQGGIGVRSGCFCAHLFIKHLLRIHPFREALANIGMLLIPDFTNLVIPGLVRVSLGIENDEQDVDRLIKTLEVIATTPTSWINRLIASTHNGTPFLPHTRIYEQIEISTKIMVERVFR
jgi:selenocysteine lyase/cysteine desulfurase